MTRSTRCTAFLTALAGLAGGLALGGGVVGASLPPSKASGAGNGVMMGRYQATPPTLTDGAPMDLLLDSRAGLVLGASTANIGTVGIAEPVSVDDNASSLTIDNAALAVVGSGAATTATLRITQATDDAAAVALADDSIALEAGTATIGTVQVTGAVDTELPTPVVLADGLATPTVPQVGAHLLAWQPNSAVWDRVQIDTAERLVVRADVVNSLPAGANNIGDVDVLVGGAAVTATHPVPVTGGTTAIVYSELVIADYAAVAPTAGLRLTYLAVTEDAAVGAATTIIIRHGNDATDPIIMRVELSANQGIPFAWPTGLATPDGIFIDRVAGSATVTVATETHP